jgi:hypothetical protein
MLSFRSVDKLGFAVPEPTWPAIFVTVLYHVPSQQIGQTGGTGELSAAHDLGAINPAGSIAAVDHQLCLPNDVAIVVVGVISHDDDAIVLSEVIQ